MRDGRGDRVINKQDRYWYEVGKIGTRKFLLFKGKIIQIPIGSTHLSIVFSSGKHESH